MRLFKLICLFFFLISSKNEKFNFLSNITGDYTREFLISKSSLIDPLIKDSPLQLFKVTASENQIYYSSLKGENKIENIIDAYDYEVLLSSEDKSEKCCKYLGIIKDIKLKDNRETYFCFTLQTRNVENLSWKICSRNDRIKINEFKQILILKVLKKVGSFKKEDFPIILTDSYACQDNLKNYKWSKQENWKCLCNIGTNQSPVKLESNKTTRMFSADILFDFNKRLDSIISIFNGHEIDIKGKFGKVIHSIQRKTEKITYEAHKINFKFPSEHFIDDQMFDGEMQLHLLSENNQKAIMTFPIKLDRESQVKENSFIKHIHPELWEFSDKEVIINDSDMELYSFLIPDIGIYNKSFFWYEGSLPIPPCYENYHYYVMKTPIVLPLKQFFLLRSKVFLMHEEKYGNARMPSDIGYRVVFEFVDRVCENENEMRYLVQKKLREEKNENDRKLEMQTGKKIIPRMVKITRDITSYDYVNEKESPKEGTYGNNQEISVKYIDLENIPKDGKEILKFKLNHKTKAQGKFPHSSSKIKAEY